MSSDNYIYYPVHVMFVTMTSDTYKSSNILLLDIIGSSVPTKQKSITCHKYHISVSACRLESVLDCRYFDSCHGGQ